MSIDGSKELRVAAPLAREIAMRPRAVTSTSSALGGGGAIVDVSWMVALGLLALVAAELLVRAPAAEPQGARGRRVEPADVTDGRGADDRAARLGNSMNACEKSTSRRRMTTSRFTRALSAVASWAVLAASVVSLAEGCSTTTQVVDERDGAAGPTASNLPPVSADQLGGSCTGFGTGIGETAAFATDMCPAGVCIVETRSTLELYCSADCDEVSCPTGWLCQPADHGVAHACFKDPNAPAPADSGPAQPPSYKDTKLTGYRANTSAVTTLALADFQSAAAAKGDLVVLVVGSLWDPYSPKQLQDLQTAAIPRVTWVGVLINGTSPNSAATPANLATWHGKYAATNLMLDSTFTVLGAGYGATLDAVPTLIALDARTLVELDRSQGYSMPSALASLVDGWRLKAK